MNLSRVLSIGLLAAFLFAGTAGAGTEVMEIDPLADKDLYHFKKEGPGKWTIDDTSDDIHTLIVCPKSKADTGLLFIKRRFTNGFRFTMDVTGGSRYKGLEFYLVPPEGDRILVPFKKRGLAKKGWHRFMFTLEKGRAQVRIDDDKGESVQVEEGPEYTFAIKLTRRSEAIFRKPMLKFLVVSRAQEQPKDGFVRIFDGKSIEGWVMASEGPEFQNAFKVADQRIEGRLPQGPRNFGRFVYTGVVFRDHVFRFKASADTRGLHLWAGPKREWVPAIDDYFDRDKDWNQVEWESKGQKVTLRIDGREVWQAKIDAPQNYAPQFWLIPGGKCTIRDIQVKGQVVQNTAIWQKHAEESGADAGGRFGGRGNDQPHPGAGAGAGGLEGGRKIFNGSDLTDWGGRPDGAWTVEDGKIIGLTLDQANPAELIYRKFVFTNYRVLFKVQRGTVGAKFIARLIPPADQKAGAEKKPNAVDIKDEWVGDKEWNDFEITATGDNLVIKVNGKQVHSVTIYKDRGFFGFMIGPNSAIGLTEIVLE